MLEILKIPGKIFEPSTPFQGFLTVFDEKFLNEQKVLIITHEMKHPGEFYDYLDFLKEKKHITDEQAKTVQKEAVVWKAEGFFVPMKDPCIVFVRASAHPTTIFHELFHAVHFMHKPLSMFADEFLSEFKSLQFYLGDLGNSKQTFMEENPLAPEPYMGQFIKSHPPPKENSFIKQGSPYINHSLANFFADWRYFLDNENFAARYQRVWEDMVKVIPSEEPTYPQILKLQHLLIKNEEIQEAPLIEQINEILA